MDNRSEEIETLPPNWRRMKLGDKALIVQASVGDSAATEKLAEVEGGTIPLIHSADLRNEKKIKTEKYVTEETYEQFKQPGQIKIVSDKGKQDESTAFTKGTIADGKGTILLSLARRGVGDVGILDVDRAMYHNVVYAIKAKPEVLSPDLLFYFLKKADIRAYLRADLKSGRQYVSVKHVKKLEVLFPEGLEQQGRLLKRIEELLSEVKVAQQATNKNREYIDTLLMGILREVFTDEFMDGWTPGNLADLVTFRGVQDLYQPEFADAPWIVPDDIDLATAFLTLRRGRVSNTVQPGVALARDANALIYAAEKRRQKQQHRLAMPYYDLSLANQLAPKLLRCDAEFSVFTVNDVSKLHPRFLFWFLLFAQIMPATETRGTARKVRNDLATFKASTLAYPHDLAQQKRISAYLDALQEQIISMQAHQLACQSATEQMEESILDQAFRGAL